MSLTQGETNWIPSCFSLCLSADTAWLTFLQSPLPPPKKLLQDAKRY